jgi:hypothetical protein
VRHGVMMMRLVCWSSCLNSYVVFKFRIVCWLDCGRNRWETDEGRSDVTACLPVGWIRTGDTYNWRRFRVLSIENEVYPRSEKAWENLAWDVRAHVAAIADKLCLFVHVCQVCLCVLCVRPHIAAIPV